MRDVVEDRVAEDHCAGVVNAHPGRSSPDDDGQLALEVELLRGRRPRHRGAGVGDRVGELAEQDRVGGRLDRTARDSGRDS